MLDAEEIIEFFGMKPLPGEGGFYVETYRAAEKVDHSTIYSGRRAFSTAIVYMLTPETFSSLHRLKSDEIFHFYLGDSVTMLQLRPDGSGKVITLGPDIINGQCVQVTVPRNTWQGAFLSQGGRFALLGTTVAPGYELADFEPAERNELLKKYPDHKELIWRLTEQK